MYICDKVKGVYLSQTALKHLNVIHKDFPTTISAWLKLRFNQGRTERGRRPQRPMWMPQEIKLSTATGENPLSGD